MISFISFLVMSCACSSGACCDGCNLVSEGEICDWTPVDEFYKCTGSMCGATLEVTYKFQVCDGVHADCGHKSQWGDLIPIDECTLFERCDSALGEDACFAHEWCCIPFCGQKQCGDDGCGGSCGECPEGLACWSGLCITPVDVCGECWKSEECADGLMCLGYSEIGGLCVPTHCNVDADCPLGLVCEWMEKLDHTACWVEPAGSMCIGNEVWKLNTCGQPYVSFIKCAPSGQVCVDGHCCKPSCGDKQCGDDGCGGVCGHCGALSMCIDGWCGECEPGEKHVQSCVEECSGRERVCTAEGLWSEWSDCVDNFYCAPETPRPSCPTAECHPGTIAQANCERCGVELYVCESDCQWYGGRCINQGVCESGESRSCDGGIQYCTSSCRWGLCEELAVVAQLVSQCEHVATQASLVREPLSAPLIAVPHVPERERGCQAGSHASNSWIVMLFLITLFGIKRL